MRIAQLVPSSGRMYCENCFRDSVLGGALRELGHEVVTVPLYLPIIRDDHASPVTASVFFGGIRVFLAGRHGLFRRLPAWLARVLDSPLLLGSIAGLAGMTEARDLGATTLSMLRGERGHQADQLEELVTWLAGEAPPDVVVLSTALLAGFARRLKERLGAPVVCLLQDEDGWLDAMPEPIRETVWRELSLRAADVDVFVSVSEYYAGVMRSRLELAAGRVRVVHPGIKLEDYAPAPESPESPESLTIGYLSPLSEAKGLTDLLEAFAILKKKPGLAGLRLRIAGEPVAGGMRRAKVRRRLAAMGLAGQVDLLPEPGLGAKPEFLRSLSVLSVPTREPEAFGVHVLEALATGVPVVQPRHGAFPEMLELTGGGVLFEPGDVQALAAALEGVLLDPARARELGRRGREGVAEHFSSGRMAREMTRVFASAGNGVFHHGDTEDTENGE